MHDQINIATIGLGYVGLPIAIALAKHFNVTGYDCDEQRVNELQRGIDRCGEIASDTFNTTQINFTHSAQELTEANFYIVAVPTPVDSTTTPNLDYLVNATKTVAQLLKPGDIVVYESTVYPGTTREICIPILEEISSLKLSKDFGVGYSPERINPGDTEHTITTIKKIVSASDKNTLTIVKHVYDTIITAGTYEATTIEVAEAAKIIENTQRDVNIALVNELAIIFHLANINVKDVLAAAATKWNFNYYEPGLVGGHCISVDPYYLSYKSKQLGHFPDIITSARKINDGMGEYVVNQIFTLLLKQKFNASKDHINLLGLTFKNDCPDLRNTGSLQIYNGLRKADLSIALHDPIANVIEVEEQFKHPMNKLEELTPAKILILAVNHQAYRQLAPSDLAKFVTPGGLIIDIKSIFKAQQLTELGYHVWQL